MGDVKIMATRHRGDLPYHRNWGHSVPTWHRPSDGSPLPGQKGHPVRLFVHADLDEAGVRVVECEVTSRAGTAVPVGGGRRDRIDLTTGELDWLIDSLTEAREALRAAARGE